MNDYATRIEAERAAYRDADKVAGLPPICFYWLDRYILPQMTSLGHPSLEHFFSTHFLKCIERAGGRPCRFLSVGAGNCEAEVRLARDLVNAGATDFVIDCLDLNEQTLERGKAAADAQGVAAHIRPVFEDFNAWQPAAGYDAVLANQVLHHIVRLEALFDGIRDALRPGGVMVVSDMIGRNGHRRWPEALVFVEQFWRELPARYRYNRQLERQETDYPDWDCSVEGFEGIRAQDILPLLLDRFQFRFFYAFGNVIDPFIDRSFGPNFDGGGRMGPRIHRSRACVR